jgi:hypothetical protein
MNTNTEGQLQLDTLANDIKETSKRIKRFQRDLKTVKTMAKRGAYELQPDLYARHISVLTKQASELAGFAYGFGQVTLEAVNQGNTDEGNNLQSIVLHLVNAR